MIRTRFAPSPTGPLHLGHAYSAILAHDFAKARGGDFVVRIEDIDKSRARSEWENKIFDDLEWLGLTWSSPVLRQSNRDAAYEFAINKLWADGLLYSCNCSRRDIKESAMAPQGEGQTNYGPDGIIYPGTCRQEKYSNQRPQDSALRLDMARATINCSTIQDQNIKMDGLRDNNNIINTAQFIGSIGDVVLSRKSKEVAYHLAVVVDDEAQAISHVVRGSD